MRVWNMCRTETRTDEGGFLDWCAAFTVYCALTDNMPLGLLGFPMLAIGCWRIQRCPEK